MKQDIIISIDIGGTTFELAIHDRDYLNIIDMSSKWHVRDYSDSESLLEAICSQINDLLIENQINLFYQVSKSLSNQLFHLHHHQTSFYTFEYI